MGTAAKRPRRRVDPALTKARQDRRKLKHLGALGGVLLVYFLSGILFFLMAIFAVYEYGFNHPEIYVPYFCLGVFGVSGKILFTKRVRAGYSLSMLYTILLVPAIPAGTLLAFFAYNKLTEIKSVYFDACRKRKDPQVVLSSVSTPLDDDYKSDDSNPYGSPNY